MLNINLITPYLVYYHGNAAFEMEYEGWGGERWGLSKGERIEKKSHHWEN